jgi:hypothetical protein
MIAGALCLGAFIFNLVRSHKTDYAILFAGIFIIAFGVSAYKKTK